MVNPRFFSLLLAVLLLTTTATAQHSLTSARVVRPAVAYDEAELLRELPIALRAAGSALLGEANEKGRARLAENLAEDHPADSLDFLIALLDNEKSAFVRAEIVSELGTRRHPKIVRALERRLESSLEKSE